MGRIVDPATRPRVRPTVRLWWHFGPPPETAADLLAPAERERLERITHAGAREGFVAGRWLARTLLSKTVPAVARDAWRFDTSANGKPFVTAPVDAPKLWFNIAHTAGFAMAAVSADVNVGVDAERITRPTQTDRLVERYFGPDEQAWLASLPDDERQRRFFDVWVLKEAAIKLKGGTLGEDIGRIQVLPGVGPVNLAPQVEGATFRRWFFDDVVFALAVEADGADVIAGPAKVA